VPCTPRFRAPALFGRLLLARVDGFVMQASENLHASGLGSSKILRRLDPQVRKSIKAPWPGGTA